MTDLPEGLPSSVARAMMDEWLKRNPGQPQEEHDRLLRRVRCTLDEAQAHSEKHLLEKLGDLTEELLGVRAEFRRGDTSLSYSPPTAPQYTFTIEDPVGKWDPRDAGLHTRGKNYCSPGKRRKAQQRKKKMKRHNKRGR